MVAIILCFLFVVVTLCAASDQLSKSSKVFARPKITSPSALSSDAFGATSAIRHLPLKGNKSKARTMEAKLKEEEEDEEQYGVLEKMRDEVVDLWEGFAYAESREEIMEHAIDILERNKVVIGSMAVAAVVKSAFFNPEAAEKVARDLGKEMRATEAAKWGKRAF